MEKGLSLEASNAVIVKLLIPSCNSTSHVNCRAEVSNVSHPGGRLPSRYILNPPGSDSVPLYSHEMVS